MEHDASINGQRGDAVARYTDGKYAGTNPQWHDEDAPWKGQQIRRLLQDEGLHPRSICDVGCGAGGVLAALAPWFPDSKLVGYEVSPQARELGHSLHPEIDIRLANGVEATERFDLALAIDVIEHIEDFMEFLRTLRPMADRHLFHIPLDMAAAMVARERPILRTRSEVGHLHYFSKGTAVAALIDVGYQVVSTRYTRSTLELPNRSWRMRVAAVPRRIGHRLAPDVTARTLGGFSLLVLTGRESTTPAITVPDLVARAACS